MPKHVGLFVFLVFVVLASVIFVLDLRASFISQILTSSLNLVFRVGALFVVAYISARSYLKSGVLQLLLIGCSMIAFGMGSLLNIAGSLLALPEWLNFALAIINISFFVFAALNLLAAGVFAYKAGPHEFRVARLKLNLFGGYFSAVLLMIILGWLIMVGIIPPFAVGREYTLARQFTLLFALGLFLLGTAVMSRIYFESKSKVLYWYSLGLGLHVISVSALLLAPGAGTALSWLGSAAQCAGSVFFIIALLMSFRGLKGVSDWTESFKRDKRQFEAFFSNMMDAFVYCKVIVNKEGKPVDWVFVEVNDSYARIAGFRKEQIIGRKVTELFPDEKIDPANWIEKYGQVALTGKPAHFEDYGQSLKRWLNVSSYSPERGYFIALFQDITERKKAEQALSHSEKRYRELFTSMTELFESIELIYDQNGKPIDYRFLDVNPAFERFVGRSRDELVGRRTVKEMFGVIEDYWLEFFDTVAKTGVPSPYENYTAASDKYYETHAWKISDKVVGVILTDITERKKVEENLEKYRNNLEKLVEERTRQLKDSERLAAIGATAGMVGHDIRNPLQAITSDVFLARTELTSIPDSEEKKNVLESMDEIEKNIDYINKIVQDLQDYARPLNPHAGEADLKLIIDKLLEKNILPKNVKAVAEVEDEARKFVADIDYLNRILYNLVTNAVQAMPQGGKLTIHVFKEANDLVIKVKDTGVGIPNAIQIKMFTPMFTTKSKGQGFGLPVVKRMTESLGGTVSFESEEGKGTTFTIRLPQSQKK